MALYAIEHEIDAHLAREELSEAAAAARERAVERVAALPAVLAESLANLNRDQQWAAMAIALAAGDDAEFARLVRMCGREYADELIEDKLAELPWLTAAQAARQIARTYA